MRQDSDVYGVVETMSRGLICNFERLICDGIAMLYGVVDAMSGVDKRDGIYELSSWEEHIGASETRYVK